ncbi:EF-hand domain-containing protein [Jiella marina]|uniref:EF-hand domain-containing protein n=1 Tax=Jiella sp. LLJ827 TaxID=2917712 RepID=UPI0021007405|nr:EF-hand domain-containing protein [Jiella sp. LLJ827]MCQ0990373.1 EF-hand domain-containing protein [Jiella sp. LLJ827]
MKKTLTISTIAITAAALWSGLSFAQSGNAQNDAAQNGGARERPVQQAHWRGDDDDGWRGRGEGRHHRGGHHGERRGHGERWGEGRHGMHHGRMGPHGWGGRGGGPRAMMHERMQELDLNQDGSLTQDEIDQARQQQLARFDADNNGTLSIEEFQTLWLERMRERMVDRFQDLDANGDGEVTQAEFDRRLSGLVERMDRNGDGKLDRSDRRGGRGMRFMPDQAQPDDSGDIDGDDAAQQ